MTKLPSVVPWLICAAVVMVASGLTWSAWDATINVNRDGTPIISRQLFIETPDGEIIPMHITK